MADYTCAGDVAANQMGAAVADTASSSSSVIPSQALCIVPNSGSTIGITRLINLGFRLAASLGILGTVSLTWSTLRSGISRE